MSVAASGCKLRSEKEQALPRLHAGSLELEIQVTLDLSPLLQVFCQRKWDMIMNSDDQRAPWNLRLPTSSLLCPFLELVVSSVPDVYNLAYSCEWDEWWSRGTWTLRTFWYFQCIFQGFILCWPRVPLLSWRMSGEKRILPPSLCLAVCLWGIQGPNYLSVSSCLGRGMWWIL